MLIIGVCCCLINVFYLWEIFILKVRKRLVKVVLIIYRIL